jgi:hypothetical protein
MASITLPRIVGFVIGLAITGLLTHVFGMENIVAVAIILGGLLSGFAIIHCWTRDTIRWLRHRPHAALLGPDDQPLGLGQDRRPAPGTCSHHGGVISYVQ